jgi:hypothetical protein
MNCAQLQINRGADATASLANVLHAAAFFLLLLADVARYYLGTAGNLRRQVFQLSAFLFLSVCPVLPALLYLCFSSEFRLPFDMVTGSMLLAFVSAEFAFGWVVLRDLLRQETARFMRLQSEEDSDDDGNGEREQAKTNDSY